MPNSNPQHLYKTIHEQIDIDAKYINGKWQIIKFRWKKHIYTIREICLTTKAMRGQFPVWFFCVVTDTGSYQLRLDTDSLRWWLEEVMSEQIHLDS